MENALSIRNQHVAFLASFDNPSVIFEQISVIYALPRLFVGSFTLVLPFFPTGTLERVRRCLRRSIAPSAPPPTSKALAGIHGTLGAKAMPACTHTHTPASHGGWAAGRLHSRGGLGAKQRASRVVLWPRLTIGMAM